MPRSSASGLCPDEEGIKTQVLEQQRAAAPLQASALTKKGLRREQRPELFRTTRRLQASALTKKGLRRNPDLAISVGQPLQASALTKKGLRPQAWRLRHRCCPSGLCPDEEGIKTPRSRARGATPRLQASALTKKGLRRDQCRCLTRPRILQASALTKKGLRPTAQCAPLRNRGPSGLCPDEEGIKTRRGASRPLAALRPSGLCPDEEGIKTAQLGAQLDHGRHLQASALTKKGLRRRGGRLHFVRPACFRPLP